MFHYLINLKNIKIMKKLLTITLLSVFTFLNTYAQFPTELENTFTSILSDFKKTSGAAGLSVAIRTTDNAWASALGQDTDSTFITTASTFGMGSVSKTITSATILQMMEDGLLTLDDQITMHLDTMTNIPPNVTIKQLLNHTSGIYNYTDHPNFFDAVLENPLEYVTDEEVLANYVSEPIFVPGLDWSYSNTNYVLLGLIVEAISGKKYYEEARIRFDFDTNYPSLTLPPYESEVIDMAHLWADVDGSGNVVDVVPFGFVLNSVFSSAGAAGAYASTPTDLAQWAHDLYTGKILQPSTMEALRTITPPSNGYGLGILFGTLPCGQSIEGHTGGIFYTTATFYDSENDFAISTHTNDAETDIVTELAVEMICAYEDFLMTVSNSDIDVKESAINISPNPFENELLISYELLNRVDVQITLINELGKTITNHTTNNQSVGQHQFEINEKLPSGIYFVRMRLGDEIITKKIVKI